MAGETTSGSLADCMPLIIDAARIRREYPPIVAKLFEYHKLPEGTGLSWEEAELSRFTAQAITETTRLTNYQQYADTLRVVTPTVSGLATLVTDLVLARMSKVVRAEMGTLMQDAIERKKDLDCLTTIDGATNSQPGAGVTLAASTISAHKANIEGNTTEGGEAPFYGVWHGWQAKDVADELRAGFATYPIPAGFSAEVFRNGYSGSIDGVEMFVDNNITIDAANDAKGGVWARKGGLFIQGRGKRKPTVRDEEYGGGAEKAFLFDEYGAAERLPNAVSVLMRELYSDATAPTV